MTCLILAYSLVIVAQAASEPGPVAEWMLREGRGESAADSGGQRLVGRVEGARWLRAGEPWTLAFDTANAHVNCGSAEALNLDEALSLEAWAYPFAAPESETGIAGKSFDTYGLTAYGDRCFYWYIGSGANKCKAPMSLRYWNHLVGTFDGETLKLYLNGKLAETRPSQFKRLSSGGDFLLGCIGRSKGGAHTASFNGVLGAVRVYSRALTEAEAAEHHGREKGLYRRMEEGLDRILVRAFAYPEEKRLFADVDFGNFAPLADGQRASIALWPEQASSPLLELPVTSIPGNGIVRDLELALPSLPPGGAVVKVTLNSGSGAAATGETSVSFAGQAAVPAPGDKIVPPLPPEAIPPEYDVRMSPQGGFSVSLKDVPAQPWELESTFSYPQGGENVFSAGDTPVAGCEPGWAVTIEQDGPSHYRATGRGGLYEIKRNLSLEAGRILVKDTITNSSKEPVGILLSNHFRHAPYDAGTKITRMGNPTVFVSQANMGAGLAALDDVYSEHVDVISEPEREGLRDPMFALDAGASYTLEWAVYFNATGDYYDFINAVRRDEHLLRTIEGGFAFTDRREPPTEEFVRLRNLKYASIGCLSHAADDPGMSVEGIEFMEYPKECALLKETFAETKRRFPGVKVMFHVAHSLYATGKPTELFPDSRTLDASGQQSDYGGNNVAYYLNYFSKEHVDAGVRWFIFYPTAENTFGQALLRAADYMLDGIGATGIFEDGLAHGYGGRYTYDRWDGHSADIDPKTKTITRKCASVNLLGQDVFAQMIRKINARGGAVIANSYPGTRTLNRENILYCVETGGGDACLGRLHVAPTVIAMGDPGRIHTERDVYEDSLAKLKFGALYFFYSEGTLTHRTLASEMYPITVESIHEGEVRGKERIVTTRSGVYGWPEDHSLHFVHRFDARGMPVGNDSVTTADGRGTRTELRLGASESAVIRRLPLTVTASEAVNCRVDAYAPDAVLLSVVGQGKLRIAVADGEFRLEKGTIMRLCVGDAIQDLPVEGAEVAFSVPLTGATKIRIEALHPNAGSS